MAADQVAAVPLAEVPNEAEEDKHSNSHRYSNTEAPFGAPFVCPILRYDKDNIYDTLLRNISSVIYATVLEKNNYAEKLDDISACIDKILTFAITQLVHRAKG